MDARQLLQTLQRRAFLRDVGAGIGTLALAHLMGGEGRTAENALAPRRPHFEGKARNVIFLFMAGAPSQLDLYDPRPGLAKWHGQSLPPSMTKDLKLAFIKPTAKLMASHSTFRPRGKCGMEISDYLPHIGSVADDLCLVRSVSSDAFNHHPGQSLLMSGSMLFGRPSMGSWVVYGLGSESQDLPGFVVLQSGKGTSGGANNWSSGFLASTYQGVPFRSVGDPILYLSNPDGVSPRSQKASLAALRDLNQKHLEETGNLEIASRIAAYELAFRMQSAAPELADFSKESPETLAMYGVEREDIKDPFAGNCLLARRLVERGVRFVMLAHEGWDHHTDLKKGLATQCGMTDQPIAALIKDLKQRGLLASTLVVWGGEFGRTPMTQLNRPDEVDSAGRDHHPNCYSMWLAGGGIRGGQVVGENDELGLNSVKDKVHVHDLQATILHSLGFNHEKLTYRHLGRDFRLTDVHGSVVQKMLA
ncbi:MAG: DUF1501 domain-containing protein [Acidobacteria bacterium]|nr:DUF1501 domain-containing protein [Acidobacteriota bacterium]